jgi:hypothetical protein
MKLFSKEQLTKEIKNIFHAGWHESVRKPGNDGAVGNTLEKLLGIKENNLPIPNAREWELKGQRSRTSSPVTLKHIEPSPTGARIVSSMLLPLYGWKHKKDGIKYPETEMSFRSTTSATSFTSKGFRVVVDRKQMKVKFIFDSKQVDRSDPKNAEWLKSVENRAGLGFLNPEPYWGFEDLRYAIGNKIRNCFYVIADSKIENKKEYFLYNQMVILSGFSFEKFLLCLENGTVLVDFDARTGHNHGTKFRIKQDCWSELYSDVKRGL